MRKELRQHFEEIISLNDDEFEHIFSHFTEKKLKKHQFLIQEGDVVNHTYWVKKGLLKAYFTDENGREHILQFAMENWWISDYQAYAHLGQAVLNIACLESTELLCLSYENREKLCADSHKVEHYFRKKAGSGFIELQKRMLTYLTNSPRKRYEWLVKTYPQLFLRVPKKTLASYLGVSRETLSRFSGK